MEEKRKLKKVVIALVMAGALLCFGYEASNIFTSSSASAASTPAVSGAPMVPANFSDLAEQARPGVVNIQTVKTIKGGGRVFRHFFGSPFQNPFGEQNPFGPGPEENPPESFEQKSLGSGFVIDRDGTIVTNNHVVENADQIKVKLSNGKEFDAKVLGRDPKTDLAVIKIDASQDLKPLRMGNSDDLKVGSWVVAIGSPFGLEQTVTAGIVSAKGRVIGSGPYDNFIQTDASINPGNSGGPLINMNGEVVGINTAIIASGQWIGLAIPVNMASEIVPQLKAKGKVTRAQLGGMIQEVTPALAQSFGLKEKKGALVSQVLNDSPAEKAGIEQGDIILEFEGKEISDSKDLPRIVAGTPVGKMVTVKLSRNGKTLTKEVKLGEMEEKTAVAEAPSRKLLGVKVQNITPDMVGALGLKSTSGVLIAEVEPGSPASSGGLQRGDVVLEVNRKPIKDAQSFRKSVEEAKGGETLLLLVKRGEGTLFAAVKMK